MPVEVRVLTESDAAAFWELRLEALEREPQAFGEAVEEHRATPVETVAGRLRDARDGFVLGAFTSGTLVGSVGFMRNRTAKRRHKGRIWGMYVRASARGTGAGRTLMEAALARVRAMPELEEVILTVTSSQQAAKRLYVSLGFEEFGHESNALRVGGESVGEDYMVLRLQG